MTSGMYTESVPLALMADVSTIQMLERVQCGAYLQSERRVQCSAQQLPLA